jgi:hypothetical protein
VIELARRYIPTPVHFADDGLVAELQAVEELLAELSGSVDLRDAAQGDAWAVDAHQEHCQAVVFGHIPVRSGQQQAVIGSERAGAPRLGAVGHPGVVAALGARDHTRQVRSTAGLGEQLDEHLVAAQRRRNVLSFLFFAAGIEDRRTADGECRGIQDQRHLIAGAFSVERLLVLDIQPGPAVLGWEADSGEPAVIEASL